MSKDATIDVETISSNAVAKREAQDVSTHREPLTSQQMMAGLDRIRGVMRDAMTEGQDYGKISGCGDKPSLFQAGAQKLSMMFQLNPEVREETITDYPNYHRGYRFIVRVSNGDKFAEGVGECSTLESKYRFRNSGKKCPECGKETIIKGKEEYGGGWLCFAKKGGCGWKCNDNTPAAKGLESQASGKVEHDNPADFWNCVPINSRILTKKGFKFHHELMIGEPVLSFNLGTGKNEWVPLEAITCFESAPVWMLYSKTTSLECTLNHSWVIRSPKSGKLFLERTDALKNSTQIIRAAKTTGGDSPITERQAAILGWILTDGNIRRGGYCTIAQSKPRYIKEIRNLLGEDATSESVIAANQRSGYATTIACHVFNVKSSFTKKLFELAGVKDKNSVPECLCHLSAKARMAMLRAMLHADGHFRKALGGFDGGSWIFTKQQPAIMETFRILATLSGFKLGRNHGQITKAGFFQPRQELCSSLFTTVRRLGKKYLSNQSVWCPTTGNGTWIMEQDGNVSITGNTVRKMAWKRGMVHAIINATNTSELWSQDLEDLAANGVMGTPEEQDKAELARKAAAKSRMASDDEIPMAGETPLSKKKDASKAKPVPETATLEESAKDKTTRETLLTILRKKLGNKKEMELEVIRFFQNVPSQSKKWKGQLLIGVGMNGTFERMKLDALEFVVQKFDNWIVQCQEWLEKHPKQT